MDFSNVMKVSLLPLSFVLFSNASTGAVLADQPAVDEKQYVQRLQDKFLKVYFPPRGPFNFAGSEIKIKIGADGQAKLLNIVQPPVVQGKRDQNADQCLQSAVKNLNPLELPPKSLKLPAEYKIRCVLQSGKKTVFRCVATKI